MLLIYNHWDCQPKPGSVNQASPVCFRCKGVSMSDYNFLKFFNQLQQFGVVDKKMDIFLLLCLKTPKTFEACYTCPPRIDNIYH